MARTQRCIVVLAVVMVVSMASVSLATPTLEPGNLSALNQAALVSGATDYDWWYGCSPTSVGMILGMYDRQGYLGASYANLAAGLAESREDTGAASPVAAAMIASSGHISDFYSGGYGASGDDVVPATHAFDCLADFMGTSQDIAGNASYNMTNGTTSFWYYTDGSPLSYLDIVVLNTMFPDMYLMERSGEYGIYEYLAYCGYGSQVVNIYNQYIAEMDYTYGFTFEDYMAQIDAGRPVVIQLSGHTVVGWGYDASTIGTTQTIYIDDTWGAGTQTMSWGGSYAGLEHYGVTVIELAGGDPAGNVTVPEPATMALFGIAIAGGAWLRRRKR